MMVIAYSMSVYKYKPMDGSFRTVYVETVGYFEKMSNKFRENCLTRLRQ